MSLKVLYIGYFHDGTGWAQGAIRNVLALDAAGVDVICRTVKLNQRQCPPPARILELEAKPMAKPDVSIQHLLPPAIEANLEIPWNIAVCYVETDGLPYSTWPHHLRSMDEIWVTCEHNQLVVHNALEIIGGPRPAETQTKKFPIPNDKDVFLRSWPMLEILKPLKQQGQFLFYSIQEYNTRKNYPALLAAWHSEFEAWEPVQLVLKVSEGRDKLRELNEKVKQGLKLPKQYKDPVILQERLSDDEVMSLHSTCDCFVTSSSGEAWSIPTMDALGMGKTPVAPRHTAFRDYLNEENSFVVPSSLTPAMGAIDTFDEIYTADENWYRVDVGDLRRAMRHAFDATPGRRKQMADKGRETALENDFLKIGTKMKEHLENGRKEARSFESYGGGASQDG